MTNKAYFNSGNRIECTGIEFTSGDVVLVYLDGTWKETRIEHNGREYYSIDGYQLIGNPVKYKPFGEFLAQTGESIPTELKAVIDAINQRIKQASEAEKEVNLYQSTCLQHEATGMRTCLLLTGQIDTKQSYFIGRKIRCSETFDASELYNLSEE